MVAYPVTFKPRPYTEREIADYRRHLSVQMYRAHWHEALSAVDANDPRLSKAVPHSLAHEVPTVFNKALFSVVREYIDNTFVEPALSEWVENYATNQMMAFQQARYERLVHIGDD